MCSGVVSITHSFMFVCVGLKPGWIYVDGPWALWAMCSVMEWERHTARAALCGCFSTRFVFSSLCLCSFGSTAFWIESDYHRVRFRSASVLRPARDDTQCKGFLRVWLWEYLIFKHRPQFECLYILRPFAGNYPGCLSWTRVFNRDKCPLLQLNIKNVAFKSSEVSLTRPPCCLDIQERFFCAIYWKANPNRILEQ